MTMLPGGWPDDELPHDEPRVYRLPGQITLPIVQAVVSGEATAMASLADGAARKGFGTHGFQVAGRLATSIAVEHTVRAPAGRSLYLVEAVALDGESYMTNTLEVALALKEKPESTVLNRRQWVPIVYTSTWESFDSYELLLYDERSAEAALAVLSSSLGRDRDTITIAPPRGWQDYGWPIGA